MTLEIVCIVGLFACWAITIAWGLHALDIQQAMVRAAEEELRTERVLRLLAEEQYELERNAAKTAAITEALTQGELRREITRLNLRISELQNEREAMKSFSRLGADSKGQQS